MANKSGIQLYLKVRKTVEEVAISLPNLKALLARGDKEVANALRTVLENQQGGIHDKRWLELICSHTSGDGTPASDLAPWLGLRVRVDKLDAEREGTFNLSVNQAALIQKRLKDKTFKIGVLSPQFAAFVIDFCKATNWHFDENESGDWEGVDEEPVETEPTSGV